MDKFRAVYARVRDWIVAAGLWATDHPKATTFMAGMVAGGVLAKVF